MLSARWLTPAVITFAFVAGAILTAQFVGAHSQWDGGYRKWPWRAGIQHALTTLPYTAEHSSSAAIDADLQYAPVHSIGPGIIDGWFNTPSACGGRRLVVRDADGTYMNYMHLDTALITAPGTQIVQGQYIARSGNSGTCTTGPHLHFERKNSGGSSISLEPISAHGQPFDTLTLSGYTSDNAGIGDFCAPGCTEGSALSSLHFQSFTQRYVTEGGYNGPGVAWDPCGNSVCWWVHDWTEALTGRVGAIQDVQGNVWQGNGALMRRQSSPFVWSSNTYWIHGAIWQKYLALGGAAWPGLGYPTSNEISGSNDRSGTPYRRTAFPGGTIVFPTVVGGQAYEVHGSIWNKYQQTGGATASPCGLPTSDELPWTPAPNGAISLFQYGNIWWNGSSAIVNCP